MIEKMEFGEPLGSTLQGAPSNGCDIQVCDLNCKCLGNVYVYSNHRARAYLALKGPN